ncbi:type VII secretion integral membrane protein EccD [Mycobacterium sp. SMC-8]|uniref:type VII secretion integral membrane protein EccD n=1 Tax=Mycobacterium sp. SMC-8 TaxID=2857060 RepID=UPI0021B39E6E|nr:type VII secretion integral membrane protein EccD [Mycobacterium sp. SMC-8]UXA14747.1 type VII secretion integral membrane protein EccD [Mycobacterium sp. SMC-8]
MPDTLRRIAVHALAARGPEAVDLVVPAGLALGELMPSIVDVVLGASPGPTHWQLTRAAGDPLDPSMSLRDNGVDDGEVLVLTHVRIPPPRRLPADPCAALAASMTAEVDEESGGIAGAAAVLVAAGALAWAGVAAPTPWHFWSAAGLSVAAASGAVAASRIDRRSALVLGTAAVLFAGVAGLLALPGTPWVAALLLSASSGFAMAVLLVRVLPDPAPQAALTAAAGALTAAAAVGNLVPGSSVVGAALSVVSLAGLALAPRLAAHTDAPHRALTALVVGWAGAAAAGALTVAATAIATGSARALGAAFAADIGVVLVLRRRVHADPQRRSALGAAGLVSLLVSALVVTAAVPAQAGSISAGVAVAAALAVYGAARSYSPNALSRRWIQYVEYLALAAVAPLAFWIAGIYGLAQQLSLT